MRKQVSFMGYDCNVLQQTYVNGQNSISLTDVKDGLPVAHASICIPSVYCEKNNIPISNDEVFIKNYSENEGILDILIESRIVEPVDIINLGQVLVHKCKIL